MPFIGFFVNVLRIKEVAECANRNQKQSYSEFKLKTKLIKSTKPVTDRFLYHVTNLFSMGLNEDLLEELKKREYTEEQIERYFSLIKYVYIGQNIRNEGILQSDEKLKENKQIVDTLLKDGLIVEQKWYRLKLFLLSNQGIQVGETLIADEIRDKKEAIKSELENYPQLLVGFLVNHFVSYSLAFDLEDIEVFDWRDLILNDDRVKDRTLKIFDLLKENGLAIITNDYVSTRGGEKREKKYVICSEVRKLLQNFYSIGGLSSKDILDCKVAYIISENLQYSRKGDAFSISLDELKKTGDFNSAYSLLKDDLNKYQEGGFVNVTYNIEGDARIFIVNKDEFEEAITYSSNNKIDKLLGVSWETFEEEPEEELTYEQIIDKNKDIVLELIENKRRLYLLTAQLSHGKSMFNSNPNTELFGLKLIDPIYDENELRDFIINLHQLVIESSANKILRFIENKDLRKNKKQKNNEISPNEFFEIVDESDEEERKMFEDSREILNNIHNLRNHYSHLQDSIKIYESNLIFKKLIDIEVPTNEEEFSEIQTVLLEKTRDALDKLCEVFINVVRKRKSDMGDKTIYS